MRYLPCEHVADTCDSCALRQAEARVAELKANHDAMLVALGWVRDYSKDPEVARYAANVLRTLRAVPTGGDDT